MNVGGGEAADQLVCMMLSGTEVAVRLSGSALKNLLALTMALAQNNKVLSGKVNMSKMLRETRDLRQFPMTSEQYKQFAKLAKKHKILFSAIRDRDDHGKLIDVILPVTELDRANQIFERVLNQDPSRQAERQPPERERNAPEREEAVPGPEMDRQEHERPRREQDQPPPVQGRQDGSKPQRQAQRREEVKTPKKGSRSGRGLNGTKTSSYTSRESGAVRTTHDQCPSVEQKLKVYRVQLEQRRRSVPAKAKTKARPKQR